MVLEISMTKLITIFISLLDVALMLKPARPTFSRTPPLSPYPTIKKKTMLLTILSLLSLPSLPCFIPVGLLYSTQGLVFFLSLCKSQPWIKECIIHNNNNNNNKVVYLYRRNQVAVKFTPILKGYLLEFYVRILRIRFYFWTTHPSSVQHTYINNQRHYHKPKTIGRPPLS